MKKRYKFITIQDFSELHGKPMFEIINNKSGDMLGTIEYYPRWRQYVCYFEESAVFNTECLLNIIDFINSVGKKTI